MRSKRIIIVQCRLSSTRLPGKALMPLRGKPILNWALSAMKKVEADYYYVATDEESYNDILPVCKECGFKCFAGSADDVLKRFCDLLNTVSDAETVIRATADNPFLFYDAASESVEEFEKFNQSGEKCDYLTYSGLPHGCGVEIFSSEAIKKAATETANAYDHEHVGPALYNHKDRYVCNFITAPEKYNHPELRTTVDTYSDYLRAINIADFISEDGPFVAEKVISACKSDKVINPVILVPSVKKGQGTGHLHRCLSLAYKNKYFVYIPQNKTLKECGPLVDLYVRNGLNSDLIIDQLPDESYKPVFVTDAFRLNSNDYKSLAVNKNIISIDEGSEFSQYSDYLLDIIPSYGLDRKANMTNYSLIEKPVNIKDNSKKHISSKKDVKKIIVCLGGEDPAGFTLPVIHSLKQYFKNAEITAVGTEGSDKDVKFVDHIPELKDNLFRYDIVITHYGLTAFEAGIAGCGVILLPTTKLHKKLAEKYNFAYIPDADFSYQAVEKAFKSENLYPKLKISDTGNSLSSVLGDIARGRKMYCPVCRMEDTLYDKVISRNETRTYRRCRKCGIVYMSYTAQPEMHYGKSYFFEDYKKQYGKTYEEDFDSIKAQGLRRIENIKKITDDVCSKKLLDIGCAYGPFLAAADDNGIIPYGTDISSDAVAYVQNELKYSAKCRVFPDIDTEREFGISQFDIVSMWYVIEHFKDLNSVLEKVRDIIKTGGIFAFSTPCGEGISARSNRDYFYEMSPADHYSVWEISKVNRILQNYGFVVKKIVSTGHHPERFPVIKKTKVKEESLLWKIVDKISHIGRLGDTVEIYCRKVK